MNLNFLLIFFIFSNIKPETLQTTANVQQERKLHDSELVGEELMETEKNISIDTIRNKIIDLHKNVKLCIDNEFEKDPAEILPFD